MSPSAGAMRCGDMLRFVSLCALLALTACTPSLPRYAPAPGASETGFYADPSEPRLALLEYRIAHYLSFPQDRPYRTICAAAAQQASRDPDSGPVALERQVEAVLLARFPELSPLSRCVRDGVGYADGHSGAPAAVFDVNEFACETFSKCTGWAGYLANGRHGWRYYAMDYRSGEWRIRPKKLDIVLTGEGG